MPSIFPDNKIVRQGTYTPDVGYRADDITSFGRALVNTWRPALADGAPAAEFCKRIVHYLATPYDLSA